MAERIFGSLAPDAPDSWMRRIATAVAGPEETARAGELGRGIENWKQNLYYGVRDMLQEPGKQAGLIASDRTPEEMDAAARGWGPGMALGMLGIGAPNAMTGAAGIAGGKLPAVSRAVTYRGQPRVVEDPFHGFSGLRSSMPEGEMSARIVGEPVFERPIVRPQDIPVGTEIIFTTGDRSRAGGTLTHVGDVKLERPVKMEGGADYPFLHADKPAIGETQRVWANAPPAATGLVNLGREVAARSGQEPLLMYMAMGKGAVDSSKQMVRPTLDLARQGGMSRQGVSSINEFMRTNNSEGKAVADFPGFMSPKLEEWAEKTSGTSRRKLMKAMDMRWARDAGAPDLGEVRYAITDPRLRRTPTGSVGLTISRFDPSVGVVPESMHSTYPHALAGGGSGTFGYSVPWHVAAPDIHRALVKKGDPVFFAERPDYYLAGKVPPDVPKTQRVTRQWIDRMERWREQNPGGWSVVGPTAIGGAAFGSLSPEDEVR